MKKHRKSILKNEKGQGMLEYVLILAVVLIIAGLFKSQIMGWFNGITGKVGSDVSGFTSGQ